jgi:hypothetical protein
VPPTSDAIDGLDAYDPAELLELGMVGVSHDGTIPPGPTIH